MSFRRHCQWLLPACILVTGCGDDETSEPEPEGSVDKEACEHFEQGPAAPITAGAMADDGAPSVDNDHRRYDISLVDVGGQNGGFVSFGADEAVDFVFFVDGAVPVAFQDGAGAPVDPEETAQSSADCSVVAGRYLIPLGVGTVYLELGPTAETEVSMVIEEAAHADAH